ncbi:MAG TPA: tetratricopeptide repeat protein [Polyangia bacterium]|jgi:tetratricopeptide (TPR) repeat protein|nr:tetratricopeptide repeat protein [Polyangia bacterium]
MTAIRSLARILVALVAFASVARAQPTHTMQPAARAHLQRGLKLYEQQHYDDAIAELREGLAVDPQPDILYALGQAERKKGNCARAIEYYQSCLALVKDPAAAAAIKVQIERCQVKAGDAAKQQSFEVEPWPSDSPARQAAPTPETPTLTTTTASTATPPPSPTSSTPSTSPSRAWSRDPLAASAVAIGLGGIIAGGVMVGLAKSRLDVASDSYQQYSDARGWPGVWAGGIVSLSLGGALVVVGVARYVVVARKAQRGDGQ